MVHQGAASPDPLVTRERLLIIARKIFSLLLILFLLIASTPPPAAARHVSEDGKSYEVVVDGRREVGTTLLRPGLARSRVGNVLRGSLGVADFRGHGLPLRRVKISPARDAYGLEVTIEVLSALPPEISPLSGKRVYAYVDISTNIPNEDLESAEVEFSIPRSWMRANSAIVAYHYNGSVWEELQTSLVGEEPGELIFSAITGGFSVFSFVDNTNEEFGEGTHENTENVDNFLRLKYGYTQGRFTSRVFDAGGIAQWDNLVWNFVEPQGGATNIAYVGAEPDTLKDGSGRVGTQWQGTYENTHEPDDGSYENLSETGSSGSVTYTVMESVENETVYAGGVISTENAMEDEDKTEAGGSNYENIHENAYTAFAYTYAQVYENARGRVENFSYQQQEAGGYATWKESGQIVYSQPEAIAVYSTGAEVPSAKRWTGSEWVSMPTPNAVGGIVEWVVVKSARTRNELILGTLDSSGDISVQIWNGVTQTWSSPEVLSNVGTTVDAYRCFDIEYENGNDRAIVVYNKGNNTDNLYYVIWDGNSWSDEYPIDVPTTGIPYWIELASNPLADNNDIALIMLDSNSDVWGMRWNGNAWDNMGATGVWDDTASTATEKAIDVAYEWTTGDIMFVWGDATTNGYVGYRTYSGGTLSSPASGPGPSEADAVRWVQLASDPFSDNILLGIQDWDGINDFDLEVAFWNGGAWPATRYELESGVEAGADQNFYLTFEINNPGYVWALFGDGGYLGRRRYTTSWGTKATSGDDTARVFATTHWFNGYILAVVMSDDSAAGTYDGIYPIWTTDGSTWNNLTATERWVQSELPANPIFERAGISCRRHWPILYGLTIYENIDNVPLAENYFLEIYYKLSNTFDKFHVYVENAQSPGTWVYAGDLNKDVWTTFSYQLTSDLLFGGENVHVKIVDNDNTKESITDVYVDYVRVRGAKPGYNLEVVHTLMAPTAQSTYTLEVGYYLAGDSENIAVYLWNFDTGQWDNVGYLTSQNPVKWSYELTGTAYILGTGKVRVRYYQTDVPTAIDSTVTSFMLNYTRVKSTTAAGQSLNWQHTITGVSSGYDNYDLKIRGYSCNDLEYIWIDVWNVSLENWEPTEYYMPRNSPSTITYRLSPLENYLDGENIYVRFRDDSSSDTTTTYLILDMVRVEMAFWATSDVKLQVRTSPDNTSWTDWMGPDGSSSTYFENTTTTMENIPDDRYIQYRIYFSSQHQILSGENGPKVDYVQINASTLPNLISPEDGINTNDSTPEFCWETVSADNYHIQVDNDSDFQSPEIDNYSIPGTENKWTPSTPLSDNLYYWRVRRWLNNSWYAWTSPWSFRVDTIPPGAPTLVSPADGENLGTNQPFLDWNPITDENSFPILYKLQVSRNPIFTDLVYETGWLENDNYLSPTLDDNTYYWRVRAMDNAGNANPDAWSPYRTFRVDNTPPSAPTLVSPAPGAWVTATPILDWNPVTGDASPPMMYYVQIAADIGFESIVASSGWITDDNWVTPPMPHATARYWRVKARDNVLNESGWSENRSFVADARAPPKVPLVYPADGENVESLTITFQWDGVTDDGSGVANYRIQIDDDPGFTSPLVDNDQIPNNTTTYQHTFASIGIYYWRVVAIDQVGNGDNWSDARVFACRSWWSPESWSGSVGALAPGWNEESWSGTVVGPTTFWILTENWTGSASAPVPAPVLISPENETNTVDRSPTLDWDNLLPADSFWIWVDNDPDFGSPITNKPKTVSNYDFDE
ncbi:MAG: PGF-pre-PGF domain-containing protein, partial [Candidatus Hadarchaeales archaeon]